MKQFLTILFSVAMTMAACACNRKADMDYSDFYKEKDDGKQEIEESRQIAVMSFNVKNNVDNVETEYTWGIRCKGVYAMLNQVAPAVVGLQECYLDQREDILQNCKAYKGYGVGRDNGSSSGESASILYRTDVIAMKEYGTFWLSETPETPSLGWDARFNRTCTWARFTHLPSGEDFFFCNTHLDHVGTTAREKSAQLILQKIDELNPTGLPVFLTGDMNCREGSVPIASFSAVLSNARPDTDRIPTSHSWGTASSQIDFIFYSGITEKRYETIDDSFDGMTYISDHYPILGEFLFNEKAEE